MQSDRAGDTVHVQSGSYTGNVSSPGKAITYDIGGSPGLATLNGNLTPSWIEAWAHIKMGNGYDSMGDRARAVNEYRKAVESGIDFDNAQKAAGDFLKTPYDPKAVTQQAASGVSE